MKQEIFGEVDGNPVHIFALRNSQNNEIRITNFGATITSWITADKKRERSNIVIGYNTLLPYLEDSPYFGATIGRYANRIANATFLIGEKVFKLHANNGKHHLHGGRKGFDKVIWKVEDFSENSLKLTYLSIDGEEGYPGNLQVSVNFVFSEQNELVIHYTAHTDKLTPVNLTNHSYFNLSGNPTTTILDHLLFINADSYTPVDTDAIPTGTLSDVTDTPYDFTTCKKIGEDIAKVPGGYDHNYVLVRGRKADSPCAVLKEPGSGRVLEVFTDQPGLQFYSGNFLDGTLKLDSGIYLQKHTGLCLETQHFPDSPNRPEFPSVMLEPGTEYHTTTRYKVSLEDEHMALR